MKTEHKKLTPEQAERIYRNGGKVLGVHEGNVYDRVDGDRLVVRGSDGRYGQLLRAGKFHPHPDFPPAIFAYVYPRELPGPEAKALIMTAPAGMLEGALIIGYCALCDWTYKNDDGTLVCDDSPPWNFNSGNYTVRIRESWQRGEEVQASTPRTNIKVDGTNWQGSFEEVLKPRTYTPGDRVTTEAEAMEAMAQGWTLEACGLVIFCLGDEVWAAYTEGGNTFCKQSLPLSGHGLKRTVTTPDPKLFTPNMTVPAALAEKLCWAGWVFCDAEIGEIEIARVGGELHAITGPLTGAVAYPGDPEPATLIRHEPWRVPCDEYKWTGEEAAAAACAAGMERQHESWMETDWVDGHGGTIHKTGYRLRWPEQQQQENEQMETKTMTAREKLDAIEDVAKRWNFTDMSSDEMHDKICTILATPEPTTLSPGEALDAHLAGKTLHYGNGHVVAPDGYLSVDSWRDYAPFTFAPPTPTSKRITLDCGKDVEVFADRVERGDNTFAREWVEQVQATLRKCDLEAVKYGCTMVTSQDVDLILAAIDAVKGGEG